MCKLNSAFAVFILFSLAAPAMAEQNALDRAQYMLRQINSQKVELEKKNTELQMQVDELKKQSQKQLALEKSGNLKLDKSNKKKDAYIDKLRDKLREVMLDLRSSEKERLQANRTGTAVHSQLQLCVDNNHKLLALNNELVQKYGDKTVWQSMMQSEPFTKIEQVEIENLMQTYQFKNEDLGIDSAIDYKPVGSENSRAPVDSESGV